MMIVLNLQARQCAVSPMQVYFCDTGHNKLEFTGSSVEIAKRTYLQITAIEGVGCLRKKSGLLAGADPITPTDRRVETC